MFFRICIFFLTACLSAFNGDAHAQTLSKKKQLYLIAHRGGVVDSTKAENSLPALQAAFKHGYQMVEIDLRITKDSVFIIQHDRNFKRYFGVDRNVTDMTWAEIQKLKSSTGSLVLSFEEALKYCSGKMEVMIDNKVDGSDTLLFGKVVELLTKYKLQKNALMIGTDESTAFFTGKVKLSCTRKQLEENMNKPGYNANHYYLFGADLSKDDVDWAKQHDILAVGVINAWRYRQSNQPKLDAAKDAQRLKATGLTHFQIDSEFKSNL